MVTFNGTVNQIENNALKVNEIKKESAEGTYPTTEAVKKFVEPIMNDYIVERGVTDIWTWEKWNSGKYVCFGNIDMSANAGTTDIFDGTASYKNVTFPFLFTELPIVNLTNNSTSDKESYGLVTCSVRNATTSGFAAQQNARGGLNMYISAYVIGKWK